jgi:hypothetical protein
LLLFKVYINDCVTYQKKKKKKALCWLMKPEGVQANT